MNREGFSVRVRYKKLDATDKRKTDSRLIGDQESNNTHHGTATIRQFDLALAHLFFGIEVIPSVIEKAVSKVTWKFAQFGNILHDRQFEKANKSNELNESCCRDGTERGPAIGA